MPYIVRKQKPLVSRHGYTSLDGYVLRFATATRSGTSLGNKVLSSASGPAILLDHSTTERTSLRADFESWFRRAARGCVERVPSACVSAETTTRCDFSRKPVQKSRVVQPVVVDALDRASIIAAYEEDTRAHSSVGLRESRLRTCTWERLHFRWFDDAVDVVPLTPSKIRAVSACFLCAAVTLLVFRCFSRELGLPVDHFTDFACQTAERSISSENRSVSQTKLTAPTGRVSILAASR